MYFHKLFLQVFIFLKRVLPERKIQTEISFTNFYFIGRVGGMQMARPTKTNVNRASAKFLPISPSLARSYMVQCLIWINFALFYCQAQLKFQLASLAELSFAFCFWFSPPPPTWLIVVIWLSKHLQLFFVSFLTWYQAAWIDLVMVGLILKNLSHFNLKLQLNLWLSLV